MSGREGWGVGGSWATNQTNAFVFERHSGIQLSLVFGPTIVIGSPADIEWWDFPELWAVCRSMAGK